MTGDLSEAAVLQTFTRIRESGKPWRINGPVYVLGDRRETDKGELRSTTGVFSVLLAQNVVSGVVARSPR